MASVIIDKKPYGHYVRIVSTSRDSEGKVRIKTLCSLGKLDPKNIESIKRLAERLYQIAGYHPEELSSRQIKEEARYNYGYYVVCKKVISIYGLDRLFSRVEKRKKLTFSLLDVVLLMLSERLHDPCSKRSSYFHQEEYLGLPSVSLHHLYRSLDHIHGAKDKIKQMIYQQGRNLFNQKLDVVFYDVTTFYFDSEKEDEGSIRQKGFGKDGKIGKTQVVMGLLIDKEKQPVSYQVYQGDTFEGHTLQDAITQLQKTYQIDRVIIVADRGMLSRANLEAITDHGFDYIVGERLKVLPGEIQDKLLDLDRYEDEWVMNQEKDVVIRYTTYSYENRTIIGTWSASRAEKDKKDREERVRRGEYLLGKTSLIQRKARHYYLKSESSGKFNIDQEKIERDQRYDGFLAISTNVKKIHTATILDHYKHLYQIEHTFRTFKTYLETRPMFHWTNRRIEGHMCLCYIAYTVLNFVLRKLKKAQGDWSESQLRATLDRMQASLINQSGEKFYLTAKPTQKSKELLKVLQIRAWPALIHNTQINSYL